MTQKPYDVYFKLFILLFVTEATLCFEFKDLERTMTGVAFPSEIMTRKGNDIMVKLLLTKDDQQHCILRKPDLSQLNLAPTNEKYELWGDGCGVRLKNAQVLDEGYWRIISQGRNDSIQGLFSVKIHEIIPTISDVIDIDVPEEPIPFVVNVGDNNTYCYLSQKGSSESIFLHGNCELELEHVKKSVQGKWDVHFGYPGSIEEETSESIVRINTEFIDVSVVEKSDEIHMSCNLKKSGRILNFCRFERMRDEKGFNLIEGLGKDRYSYYGNGLYKKECGMKITNPKDEDYGNWKCSLGVYGYDNATAVLHRILSLQKPGSRLLKSDTSREILGIVGKQLRIRCFANTTISYCSVQNPAGFEYNPRFRTEPDEELEYWYTKDRMDIGECEMILKEGKLEHDGKWTCYMGQSDPPGIELTDSIDVRIGGKIVAIHPVVITKLDDSATLHCLTAGGLSSLKYCRFSKPNGIRFSVDESITSAEPILNKYYFKEEASINRGDCAIVIKNISSSDIGMWRCSATLDEDNEEHSDVIELKLNRNMSTASTTGLIIGLIVLVAIAGTGGYFVWKTRAYRKFSHRSSVATPRSPPEEPSVQYGRPSVESDTSGTELGVTTELHFQSKYGASTSK